MKKHSDAKYVHKVDITRIVSDDGVLEVCILCLVLSSVIIFVCVWRAFDAQPLSSIHYARIGHEIFYMRG